MNKYIPIIVAMLLALASCANRGQGPQGGPRDTIPPAVVKQKPLNGSVLYTENKIEIVFDEYIQLDNVQNNVLISPPQQNQPEIKAFGKTLSVVLLDSLQDSTTYTIDFGAAICDYNEKTPLEGYVFSFSTGDHIDSLSIGGCLYEASNLNTKAGILVGIHSNLSDTAFSTLHFDRVTRSDSEGRFRIHNVRPGSYRLYALDDISRDNRYQPGESLAFLDSIIVPSSRVVEASDTIWRDTLGIDALTGDTLFTRQVDSVRLYPKTLFTPDSLELWYFTEAKQRHYHERTFREEQHAFTLVFSAPQDTMPVIRPLRPSEVDSLGNDSAWVNFLEYAMLQTSKGWDTITYWLIDSIAIRMDSIHFEMQYKVTDSIYNLVPQTDTVLAVYRHPRISEKAMEAYLRNKRNRKLELKTNATSSFDIYDTLVIHSPFPIDSIHTDKIRLQQKVDTIFKPVEWKLMVKDSLKMDIYMLAQLQAGESYQLIIDSAACKDIYGAVNDSTDTRLKLKTLDQYASLVVKMKHFDARARIQLLNDKDEVLRELSATKEGAKFQYMQPTTYYMRLYIDENADGKWTTGDWLFKRQAEPIYYFPKRLKLRANWDFEENFDHLAIPQVESKPASLQKKPKSQNQNRRL